MHYAITQPNNIHTYATKSQILCALRTGSGNTPVTDFLSLAFLKLYFSCYQRMQQTYKLKESLFCASIRSTCICNTYDSGWLYMLFKFLAPVDLVHDTVLL